MFLWFLDRIVANRFQKGDYDKILKVYSYISSNEDAYSVYRNVIRIVSLIKTNNASWMSDYKALLKLGTLEKLGVNDAKYIRSYIYRITNGETVSVGEVEEFEIERVSKRTKKYFSSLEAG